MGCRISYPQWFRSCNWNWLDKLHQRSPPTPDNHHSFGIRYSRQKPGFWMRCIHHNICSRQLATNRRSLICLAHHRKYKYYPKRIGVRDIAVVWHCTRLLQVGYRCPRQHCPHRNGPAIMCTLQ